MARVTRGQGDLVVDMANEKGVPRNIFQSALTDGRISQFLDGLVPVTESVPVVQDLKTWKTIRVGTHKTADAYRAACKAAGIRISDWGNDILGKIAFPQDLVEEDVEFVRASNQDLGLTEGATKEDTEKRALELGLLKCMPWDGPAIRVAYPDQPLGEWFLIMMDAITDSRGYLSVFVVERDDDGLWLNARDGYPDRFWYADDVWLFRRKKSLEVKA